MKMKYIRYPSGFVLWPSTDKVWHSHMDSIMRTKLKETPISAGFAGLTLTHVGMGLVCYGLSESMGLNSLPEDTALLNVQILGKKP